MTPRQKKRDVHKLGLMALVMVSLVAIVAAVVLVVRFSDENPSSGSAYSGDVGSTVRGFSCDPAEALLMYPLGNGVLRVSRYRISYLDNNGNEVFGESVEMSAPVCRIAGQTAIIADTQGVFYITLNAGGVKYSANAPNTIDFASINQSGYTLLLMDEPNMKGVVRVSDPSGKGLFTWKSAESGYILSAEISPDSAFVDMSILNTDSAVIKPFFRRFSIYGEAVAQIVSTLEEIYPMILYDEQQTPVYCGQTSLVALQGSDIKYTLEFDRIFTAASSEYGLLLIARENEYDPPFFARISADGTVSEKITLTGETTTIAVSGKTAAVGSGNEVVVISLTNLQEKGRVSFQTPVLRVGFSVLGNTLTAVTRDGVRFFAVP